MKIPKILASVVFGGWSIGLTLSFLLPTPTPAIGCRWDCWELRCRVPDFGDCTQNNYAVYKYYPFADDIECGGPFTCAYNGTTVACVDDCGLIPPPEKL